MHGMGDTLQIKDAAPHDLTPSLEVTHPMHGFLSTTKLLSLTNTSPPLVHSQWWQFKLAGTAHGKMSIHLRGGLQVMSKLVVDVRSVSAVNPVSEADQCMCAGPGPVPSNLWDCAMRSKALRSDCFQLSICCAISKGVAAWALCTLSFPVLESEHTFLTQTFTKGLALVSTLVDLHVGIPFHSIHALHRCDTG